MTDTRPEPVPSTEEVELLDRYWDALARDASAPAPANLSMDVARLSQRLFREARAIDPSSEVLERLERGIDVEATTTGQKRPMLPRWLIAVPAAAAVLAVAIVGIVALGADPQTASAEQLLRSAAAIADSPRASGIETLYLESETVAEVDDLYQESVGGVRERSVTRLWYGGPDRERYESETSVLGADGSVSSEYGSSRVTADGTMWQYASRHEVVQIQQSAGGTSMLQTVLPGQDLPDGRGSGTSLEDIITGLATCFDAAVTGSEEIAGRTAHVLDLEQTGCFSNSIPGHLQGRQVWFIDEETSLVLGRDQYDTSEHLISRLRTTAIEINGSLDPAAFVFEVPAGATVVDYRPLPAPTEDEFELELEAIAGTVDFPLFVPAAVPNGLLPRAPWHPGRPQAPPSVMDEARVVMEYVSADEAESDAPGVSVGFALLQTRATYEVVQLRTQHPQMEPIDVDGFGGWLLDGTGRAVSSAVSFVRDGTFITVSSMELSPDELLAIAGSLEPVAGSHPPLPDPEPLSLEETRAATEHPIFVPTWVPDGLAAAPLIGSRIEFTDADGAVALTVLNGPAGCCLAADPRKTGETVALTGGLEAHLLDMQPEYGGPILWWEQDGTYVAVSGPELTQDQLVRIAESMSATADLPVGPSVGAPRGRADD